MHTHTHIYSAVNRFLAPSCFFFVHICHNFQIIKLILILHKDNASKYKMQFLNDYFIY